MIIRIRTTKRNTKKSGFIALISAIIISVVLLLLVTNLSMTSFYGRMDILDSELKERSIALSEGCGDVAILKLTQDSSYSPNSEVVNIDGDSCTIQSVATSGSHKIINIQTNYKNYYTNLKITMNGSDLSVVSWEEI